MLIDRVLADLDIPDPEDRTGNPIRGSRLGRCARQSAYMLWPQAYPPEPLPARAKLVFKFGDLVHDLIRAEFRRVIPGEWGMEEERFHFKVPLTVKDAKAAHGQFKNGTLRGYVMDRGVLRRWEGEGNSFRSVIGGKTRKLGLWLDLAEPALYVPLHVDGITELSGVLATAEIKSMALGSFKRAVTGHVDYFYRVQMATAIEATALDTQVYIAVNKNSSHMLEIVYSKQNDRVTVGFTKQSQLMRLRSVTLDEGAAGDWEAAEVQHPFEPHLVEEARERVRRILRATVTNLPEREYGPDFNCETCDGTGMQANNKTTGEPLKRGPKPCDDCEKATVEGIEGVGKPSGQTTRANLPWPCRYCPFVFICWGALVKFEIVGERPFFWIDRREFEQSGVTYKSPE